MPSQSDRALLDRAFDPNATSEARKAAEAEIARRKDAGTWSYTRNQELAIRNELYASYPGDKAPARGPPSYGSAGPEHQGGVTLGFNNTYTEGVNNRGGGMSQESDGSGGIDWRGMAGSALDWLFGGDDEGGSSNAAKMAAIALAAQQLHSASSARAEAQRFDQERMDQITGALGQAQEAYAGRAPLREDGQAQALAGLARLGGRSEGYNPNPGAAPGQYVARQPQGPSTGGPSPGAPDGGLGAIRALLERLHQGRNNPTPQQGADRWQLR